MEDLREQPSRGSPIKRGPKQDRSAGKELRSLMTQRLNRLGMNKVPTFGKGISDNLERNVIVLSLQPSSSLRMVIEYCEERKKKEDKPGLAGQTLE